MREMMDPETFGIASEGKLSDDDKPVQNQVNANQTSANAKPAYNYKPPAAPTGLKPSNFRK